MSIDTVNHIEKALTLPSSKLKGKDNFDKLLTLLTSQLQEVEEAIASIASIKDIDNISGVWLDYLGSIVGTDRNQLSDNDYREELKLKIGINTSDGTPNNVSEIIKASSKAQVIRIYEGLYMYGQLLVKDIVSIDNTTWDILQNIKPITSNIILAADTNGTSIDLGWEVGSTTIEAFELYDGTDTSIAKVVDINNNLSTLFVNVFGDEVQYFEGTGISNIMEWEAPDYLDVNKTTDVVLDFYVTPDGVTQERLALNGLEVKIEDFTTLFWEVNEDTSGELYNEVEINSLENIVSNLYTYTNTTLYTHLG